MSTVFHELARKALDGENRFNEEARRCRIGKVKTKAEATTFGRIYNPQTQQISPPWYECRRAQSGRVEIVLL